MADAFDARCERREGAVVIVACGELDLESAGRLEAVMNEPEASAPTVILDLRAVTFIDSSGVSAVVAAHQRAQVNGSRLVVAVGGAAAVERVFGLAGLFGFLELVGSPDTLPVLPPTDRL